MRVYLTAKAASLMALLVVGGLILSCLPRKPVKGLRISVGKHGGFGQAIVNAVESYGKDERRRPRRSVVDRAAR